MEIIHKNGYTRDELMEFWLVVYRNLLESVQAIVNTTHNYPRIEYTQTRLLTIV